MKDAYAYPVLENDPATPSSQTSAVTYIYEDANVIRFAAGYICKNLKEIIESSQQNNILLRFINNLIDDNTQHDGSVTTDWITLIDRGGYAMLRKPHFFYSMRLRKKPGSILSHQKLQA